MNINVQISVVVYTFNKSKNRYVFLRLNYINKATPNILLYKPSSRSLKPHLKGINESLTHPTT